MSPITTPLPPSYIIHGAMVDDSEKGGESVTDAQIKAFNNNAGKNLGTVYFTDKWFYNQQLKFPVDQCRMIKNNGATPVIRIQNAAEDEDGAPGSMGKFSHSNILKGKLDKALKLYAIDAKVFNSPICIEFGTEINGGWFAWSDQGADKFKKAFRYIVKIFRDNKVDNVKFVYHVDITDNQDNKWYPGGDVVDIIGTSCYGGYGSGLGCIDSLEQYYDDLQAIDPKKNFLAILEWGLGDPKDTLNTLQGLPNNPKFPNIKLIQLWNERVIAGHSKDDEIPDGRIDVSVDNLAAYKKGIAHPTYISQYKI